MSKHAKVASHSATCISCWGCAMSNTCPLPHCCSLRWRRA